MMYILQINFYRDMFDDSVYKCTAPCQLSRPHAALQDLGDSVELRGKLNDLTSPFVVAD